MRTRLPIFYQHINCITRLSKTLDHCYSNFRDAYKALPRPPFSTSDHDFIWLLPSYRQKLKQEAPVLRSIQRWSDQSDSTLRLIQSRGLVMNMMEDRELRCLVLKDQRTRQVAGSRARQKVIHRDPTKATVEAGKRLVTSSGRSGNMLTTGNPKG